MPSLLTSPVSDTHSVDMLPDPPTRTLALVRDAATLDPITVTLAPPVLALFDFTVTLTLSDSHPA